MKKVAVEATLARHLPGVDRLQSKTVKVRLPTDKFFPDGVLDTDLLASEIETKGWQLISAGVHSSPELHLVVEGGELKQVYSSEPELTISVLDLDLVNDPESSRKSMHDAACERGLFAYRKEAIPCVG